MSNPFADIKPLEEREQKKSNPFADIKPLEERLQPTDPRNGLSKSQIAEAEANKKAYHKPDDALATVLPFSYSDAVSFGKGFTHNIDEYGASINKGLGKLSKAILPKEYQTTFFEDNQKYWDDNRKMNEIETEDNKIAHVAGEMLNDPVNLTPAGIINKGTKLARVGKSMVAGAGVGYATSKAKNYGNDNLTDAQKSQEDAMSVGIVSALNGVIAGLTKGRITNAIKDVEHLTTSAREEADSAINAVINTPEIFGLSKAEATKLSEEYQALLKAHTGRSSRLPQDYGKGAKDSVEATQNWRPVPQHEVVKYNPIIDSVLNRKPEITTPKSYRQTDGSFDWEAFGNEHPEGKIFDAHGNELDMPTPQPELIREKSNSGFNEPDNIDGLDFTGEEIAKVQDGLKNRSDLSSDADTFISNISTTLSKSKNPIALELKNIIETDPLAQRALDSARERYAKQTYNETAGGSAGSWIDPETGLVKRAGNKGSKNADFEFALTKSDINKILKGDVSDNILLKLKQDMSRYENDPMFNTEVPVKGKFSQVQYDVAHDSLSTVEKQVRGEQGSLGFEGTQNPLFVPEAETQLVVPKWAKGLVSDTTRYEDIVKAITDAKNGIHSDLADRAVQTMSEDADIAGKLYPEVNPNTLFSNAGHNLAGGFGAGTVNAGSGLFDGSYDPNKDLTDQMADKFIQGMVAGTLGVSGLKALRKANPKAFEKVRSWVMDNDVKVGDKMPTDGVQLGVFAGKKAKGFEGRTTHAGKYDGQERFEIDDSVAKVNPNAVVELSQKGHTTLGKLMKHDELFSNYPQLENVVVKFDKNMDAHATFDGENVITLSNKFKNKDEMASSILHEVQHWVQNKEGFAGGGNFDDMLRQVDGKIYDLEKRGELSELDAMNYRNDLDYLKNNRSAEAYNNYKKIAGEIEAREVQARHGLNAEERGLIEPYNNSETLGAGEHSDEAYNSAFMAELDGKLKDFDTTGIDPKDATLDFSRNKMDAFFGNSNSNDSLSHLEEILGKDDAKEWTDLSQGLKSSFKASFLDTFSGDYHKLRANATAGKHKISRQAERMGRVLGKMPEKIRADLQEYIVGDVPPSSVSQEVRQMGDNIKQTIKDLQDEMRKLDIFDDEQIDAWGDNYLKRLYEKHFGEDESSLARGIMGNTFGIPAKKKRGYTETISQKKYDERVANGDIDESLIGVAKKDGGLIKSVLAGKVTLERDWTKAERVAMGEIVDASVTVPETFMKMAQMVEHGRMLQEVAKLEGAIVTKAEAKLATKEALNQAGFVKLETTPRFGALSGQYVRKDVADDIGALADTIQQREGDITAEAKALWMKYLSTVKKAMTVWNLATHVNNAGANPYLMHASGMNSLEVAGGIGKSIILMSKSSKLTELLDKEAINALSSAERTELGSLKNEMKYYIEAEEQGLLNTSRLEDIKIGQSQTHTTKKKSWLKQVDDYATKKYQDGDGMSKLAMFTYLREAGWSIEKSREGALAIMPDYSKPMAPAWRTLRDSGITPFISWTYYTLPKMLKLGGSVKGSWQVTKAIASLYAMSYVLTGIRSPYSDELPDDAQMSRVPVWKDGSKITTVKMDRINPFMQLMHPIQMGRETAMSGLPQTLLGLLSGTKLYNGRPVTYENKPKAQQLYDKAKYASGLTPLPGQVRSGIDFIESLVRDDKNRKISRDIIPRSTLQNALKQVGVNSLTFDSKQVKKDRRKKESKEKWF